MSTTGMEGILPNMTLKMMILLKILDDGHVRFLRYLHVSLLFSYQHDT